MSWQASAWVQEYAPVESQGEGCVLYVLANHARADGTAAWPSQQTIAEGAWCSDRTVRRHLKALEERGLIYRGDQRLVAHFPRDQRPVVWNLNLSKRKEKKTGQEGPDNMTSRETEKGPDNLAGRSVGVRTTGQGGSEGPDTRVLQTTLEPPLEPPLPPIVPQGGPTGETGAAVSTIKETTPSESSRGTRLDPEFFPSPATLETVRKRFPGMTPDFLELEHEKFHNHFASVSGARGTKRDWNATWRNWIYNSVDRLRPAERTALRGTPSMATNTAPSKQQSYRDLAAQMRAEAGQ